MEVFRDTFPWFVPSKHTKSRLPVTLAHETNHNVRFQFMWIDLLMF
ncbi:DUF2268 domain-containing putative Zn-dependent protease [Clostridium sp. AN503]